MVLWGFSAEQHHLPADCIQQSSYCQQHCVPSAVDDGHAFCSMHRTVQSALSDTTLTRFQPQSQQHSNMQESASFANWADGAPQQPSVRNSGLSLQMPSHDDSSHGSILHSYGQSHGHVAMGSRHSYLLDAAPSSKPAQAECGMSQQTAMPSMRWIEPSALAAPGMQMQVHVYLVHHLWLLQIMHITQVSSLGIAK